MSPNLALNLIKAGLFEDATVPVTEDRPGGHKKFIQWPKERQALLAAATFPVEDLRPPADLLYFVNEVQPLPDGTLDLDGQQASILVRSLQQYRAGTLTRFNDLLKVITPLPENCITVTTSNLEINHVIKYLEHIDKVCKLCGVDKQLYPLQYNSGSFETILFGEGDVLTVGHLAVELALIFGGETIREQIKLAQNILGASIPDAASVIFNAMRKSVADRFLQTNKPPSPAAEAMVYRAASVIADEAPEHKALWASYSTAIVHDNFLLFTNDVNAAVETAKALSAGSQENNE